MNIYLITNKVNGKLYVGQTIRSLPERMMEHKRHNTREKLGQAILGRAIHKYGWNEFSFELLEQCDSQDDLNTAEQRWITHHGCMHPKGYNLDTGGRSGGKKSTKTKENMSLAAMGRPVSDAAKLKISKAATGRKATIEAREKMVTANLGRKHSEATKALIGAVHRGKVVSTESRAKISAAAKLRPPPTQETRDKISKAGIGRSHSVETHEKMQAIRTGRVLSEESRMKISTSLKARYAAQRATHPARDHQPKSPSVLVQSQYKSSSTPLSISS